MRGQFLRIPLIRLQKMSMNGHFLKPPSPQGGRFKLPDKLKLANWVTIQAAAKGVMNFARQTVTACLRKMTLGVEKYTKIVKSGTKL
jgi:hypothetical protein